MFEYVSKQIIDIYSPEKVVLFGSNAKGTAKYKSDIDLCVIVSTSNKRELLADMYYSIDSEKPLDILLYTPEEWEQCIYDSTSFAYKINREGVVLYG